MGVEFSERRVKLIRLEIVVVVTIERKNGLFVSQFSSSSNGKIKKCFIYD